MTWEALLLRAVLVVPPALALAATDRTKFRGWRQRCAKWRREGVEPPPEYRRDNRLWRWRIVGLAAMTAGFAAIVILLSMAGFPPAWMLLTSYVVALAGASVWGVLGALVR